MGAKNMENIQEKKSQEMIERDKEGDETTKLWRDCQKQSLS